MEGRIARIGFHEELDLLEESLQHEGGLTVRSIQAATQALVDQDLELADEVIAFDDEVDDRYFAIEKGVESLLARQTPVATDLRLVLAILHINLHLERMADLCTTVAKLTKLAAVVPPDARIVASLAEMGVRAEEMARVAMRSFQHRDLHRAEALVDLDELIDRANRRTTEHVLELGDRAARVGPPDARRLPVHGADRRPRRRHRRADRIPRHGRVPRVHRRIAARDQGFLACRYAASP